MKAQEGGTVITELERDDCPDCGRIYYEQGVHHMIEAARCRDGCLADQWLAKLEGSRKRQDREALAVIIMVFEDYAHRDSLDFPREINDLRDGIREIKAGSHRFPFFHPRDGSTFASRLTHGFPKRQRFTERQNIDKAIWVRREDLAS
ncbi:hypothetical protein OG689_11095 [Kitasatospora sp. NBC_00240]|uniref:hypothetical protein n=1 Tax=Kitasatospora sp. NBC_00240 TaxID=2903567 RepID=UPI002253F51B|nr:hypothetical protein [Kitasatospora sp. NBC_00240]MCX5209831.1 hypothetical protein [Kitasatospora sp. NBC_00240]